MRWWWIIMMILRMGWRMMRMVWFNMKFYVRIISQIFMMEFSFMIVKNFLNHFVMGAMRSC